VALPLRAEHRQRGGDAVQHAAQVDVDHRRPAGHVEVGHGADLADAGVAHEHVEPPELRHGQADESFEVVAGGDVHGAGDGAPAALADLLGDLVEPRRSPRAEHDGGAPLGEQAGGGLADSAARSGDGHDLAADG
jgi:hypothetical protein